MDDLLDAEQFALGLLAGGHIGRGQEGPPLFFVDVGQDRGGRVPRQHGAGGVGDAFELVVVPGDAAGLPSIGDPDRDLPALVGGPRRPSAIGRRGEAAVRVFALGSVGQIPQASPRQGLGLGGHRMAVPSCFCRCCPTNQVVGLCGGQHAFEVEADAAEGRVKGPPRFESTEDVHRRLATEGLEDEAPQGFPGNACLAVIQHLQGGDLAARHEVVQSRLVRRFHVPGQGVDHAILHPAGQGVELGVLDHILPIAPVQVLPQQNPIQPLPQLQTEGCPIAIKPREDLLAMNGGRAADVARIRTVDADVALAEVGVLVEDEHIDAAIEPQLQVRFDGGQVGQEAVEAVFGKRAPAVVEVEGERVGFNRLPVEGAVLDTLLAKGHVESIVELAGGRP